MSSADIAAGSDLNEPSTATRSVASRALRFMTSWSPPARAAATVITLPAIDGLHRAIARAIIAKRQRLTPTEIRFLRKQLGLSGLDLAIHLGTTPESVSRWENGRTAMGVTADRLLRLMVAVSQHGATYSLNALRVVARREPRAMPIHVRWNDGEWEAVTL